MSNYKPIPGLVYYNGRGAVLVDYSLITKQHLNDRKIKDMVTHHINGRIATYYEAKIYREKIAQNPEAVPIVRYSDIKQQLGNNYIKPRSKGSSKEQQDILYASIEIRYPWLWIEILKLQQKTGIENFEKLIEKLTAYYNVEPLQEATQHFERTKSQTIDTIKQIGDIFAETQKAIQKIVNTI